MRRQVWFAGLALCVMGFLSCSPATTSEEVLFESSFSDLSGVLTRSGVELDPVITGDGNGSVRIRAEGPTTVRLFEVEGIDAEDTRLVYRARLRSEGLEGQAYLEMWARLPGKGEFFSRALQSPISGSTQWVSQETPFFLEKGQKPDLIKLNLVVDGRGTVWIDEVKLARSAP